MLYECAFCHRTFDELPFWGCCSACYSAHEDVRAIVDAHTPQTIRAAFEYGDAGGMPVVDARRSA